MIVFWIVVGALSAGVAGLILSRAARAQDLDAADADATLSLYRRQLAEIDELAARGLIAADERRGAHAEAARRLLGAAEGGDKAGWVVGAKDRRIVLMVAAAAPLGALALYLAVGAPGYADQPYLERLAAWRSAAPSELDAPQMAAVLRAVTTERPDDPEPYRFLAIAEMASGDSAAAVRALREAITRAPERALLGCLAQARDAGVSGLAPWTPFSIQRLLGWLFWPFALAMGVPLADCTSVATLLGEKTVLNEFVAFLHLAENLDGAHAMSPRAAVIVSYAPCGRPTSPASAMPCASPRRRTIAAACRSPSTSRATRRGRRPSPNASASPRRWRR